MLTSKMMQTSIVEQLSISKFIGFATSCMSDTLEWQDLTTLFRQLLQVEGNAGKGIFPDGEDFFFSYDYVLNHLDIIVEPLINGLKPLADGYVLIHEVSSLNLDLFLFRIRVL